MDIIIFTDVYGNVYLSYFVSLPFATVSHANADGFPFFLTGAGTILPFPSPLSLKKRHVAFAVAKAARRTSEFSKEV